MFSARPLVAGALRNAVAALLLSTMIILIHGRRHLIEAGSVANRLAENLRDYFLLGKPRVNSLTVFTAVAGMVLAVPVDLLSPALLIATLGILLASCSAAVCNGAIDRQNDAVMARTRDRPQAMGRITSRQAWIFATSLGFTGLLILFLWVNLTMWLILPR